MSETRNTTPDAVLAKLRHILAAIGVPESDARTVPVERDLVRAGLLDSIGLIGLALRIEKDFGFRIAVGEADRQSFATLAALARLVMRGEREGP